MSENWVLIYIKRWLESTIEIESKELVYREGQGTPQGGVISPLLANLFLHYVFDLSLGKSFPHVMFVRYAEKIIAEIKSTNFQRWTNRSIEEIAEFFNSKILGWINYYGKFRKHRLNPLFRIFERRLIGWARKRYKRLRKSYIKASNWFYRFKLSNRTLFAHWERGFKNA